MSVQRLRCIEGFRLVTADPQRLVRFYTDVLGCVADDTEQPIGPEEMHLLGLTGGGRRWPLRLGQQTFAIEAYDVPGRPYPQGGDAASPWFQHLALVVADIAAAFARVRDIIPISVNGPHHLPASSGGVHASKFRDPDGHPLELLQFPANGVPSAWRRASDANRLGCLGIDHSAISVADADASAAFYAACCLTPGERTDNAGPEQEGLDDLRNVRVTVVPMRPAGGTPHLELLGYRVPQPGRGMALQANDVASTRIVWIGASNALLRDPDGHLQQVCAAQPESGP